MGSLRGYRACVTSSKYDSLKITSVVFFYIAHYDGCFPQPYVHVIFKSTVKCDLRRIRMKKTVYYKKSNEELLDELRQKAEELGRAPKIKDIENINLYIYGFGSWNNALIAAGFKPNTRKPSIFADLSEQQLIDLVRPYLFPFIKQKEYEEIGREHKLPSGTHLAVRMGGWSNFLLKAEVPIVTITETDDELIEMYKSLSAKLGHPARITDLNDSEETPNYSVFNTRFGSLNDLRGLAELKRSKSRQRIKDEEVQNAVIFVRKKYGEISLKKLIQVLHKENLPSYATLFVRLQVQGITELWEKTRYLENQLKICKASDCTNTCGVRKSYCSSTCRYRESKRRQIERRVALGVCLQCGGVNDRPESDHCSECYTYFHERYKKSSAAKT